MQLTTHKEEHKKRSRRGSSFFLTRPFSQSLLSSFFTALYISKRTLQRASSSPKARRGVSSLSLILLFYCYSARGVKIYIERDERASLEPTREKQKKRSEFYFLLKALLLQNIFSSKPNHRAERNER